MTSNSGASSDGRSYTQIVSEVPPVPPAVLSRVAETSYGQRNSSWSDTGAEIPQIMTALVLIEQSPAGKAWGVQLAAVPAGTRPSDGRFSTGYDNQAFLEAAACVEWFFKRSNLSETAPMATVKWAQESKHTSNNSDTVWKPIVFTCDVVLRMLYAAQKFDADEIQRKLEMRLAAMEKKLEAHEEDIASLNLKLQQLQVTGKTRTPTVTCLMHLFADRYTIPTCMTCNPLPADTSASVSSDAPKNVSTDESPSTTRPTFNLAPHTDRLADLSEEAQNWFLEQLNTRSVWVRATDDPDSEDNHISWTQFSGAVKMGKSVAFWYGKHRFW